MNIWEINDSRTRKIVPSEICELGLIQTRLCTNLMSLTLVQFVEHNLVVDAHFAFLERKTNAFGRRLRCS